MKIAAVLTAALLALSSTVLAAPSPNKDYGYYKPKKPTWKECSANDVLGKKILIESVDPGNQYKSGGKYGYGDSKPRVLEAHGEKWDVSMEETDGSKAQIFTVEDSGYSHNKYIIRSYKWHDKCVASVVESTKSNSHVLLTDCDKKHYDGGKKSYDDDYSKPKYDDYGNDEYSKPKYDDYSSSDTYGDSEPVYRRDYGDQSPPPPPSYDKPSYEKPKYEKPKYEKPKYEKPKYEKPKYEKPKYEKPKYEKPKYEDKHDYGYNYQELSKEWAFLCNEETHEIMVKSTSGKCLDDYGATEDHVDVTTYPCEEWNAHQYWKLYVIKEKDYGKKPKQYEEV